MDKSEKEILRKDLEELFVIHLNGQEDKFKSSLEEIKRDLEIMSDKEIKMLRRTLNAKFYNE